MSVCEYIWNGFQPAYTSGVALFNNGHVLLALGGLLGLRAALDEGIAVLIGLELGDDNVGRVDSDLDSLAIDLLASELLDVDNILSAGDEEDLSFLRLVLSVGNDDLIVLTDGGRTDTELGAQVLGEGGGHADAALVGAGSEVSLALLSARRRNACRRKHQIIAC